MKFSFPLAIAITQLILLAHIADAQWVRQYPLAKMEDVLDIDISPDGYGFAAGSNDLILRLDPVRKLWDLLPGYGEEWRLEAVDYLDGSEGEIAVVGGQGLIMTTDHGQTWNEISGAPEGIHTLKIFSLTHIIAMGDDGVFSWENGTWTDLDVPATASLKGGFILDDQRLWAFTFATDPAIYYSVDGGETWNTNTDIEDIDVVVFFDAMTGTATDGRFVYSTNNGGVTWTLLSSNAIHNTSNDLTYGTSSNVLMSATPNGNPAISTDGGLTWEQLSTALVNQRNFSIAAVSDTEFWLGSDLSSVAHTTDQGGTWVETSGPERNLIQDVHFATRNIGFATGQGGYLLRTLDGGANWKDISFGTRTYFSIQGTVNDLWMGSNQRIYHSTDTGSTWVEKGVFAGGNINDILALSADKIIAASSSGNIILTRDGGATWDTVYTGVNQVRSIARVDNDKLLATGFNGLLLRSVNQGETWQSLTAPEAGLQYEQAFFLEGEGWLVTSSFKKTMWHTTNNGDTWTPLTLPVDRFWDGVYFITPDTGIVVGRSNTEGRAYITYTGGQTWTAGYVTPFPLYGVAGLPNPNGTAWIYGYGSDIEILPYCSTLPSIAAFEGDLFPCEGETVLYTVQAENVETFNWLFPPGWQIQGNANNDSVYVLVGKTSGFISISGTNICGPSGQMSFSAGADLLPLINTIQGNAATCAQEITTYTTGGMNVDEYVWSFPSGWQIQGNANQSLVEVLPGTMSGIITVSGVNECGAATAQLSVESLPLPTLTLIDYNPAPCAGDTTFISYSTELALSFNVLIGEGLDDWEFLNATPEGLSVIAGTDPGNLILIVSNETCFSTPLPLTFDPVSAPNVGISYTDPELVLTVSDNSNTYQWYLNGTLLSGFTEPTLIPGVSGTYHAVVTFPNGCSTVTESLQVIISAVDDTDVIPVQVFPVPAKDKLYINGISGKFTYSISDVAGKKVSTGEAAESVVDVHTLTQGFYFITIKTQGQTFGAKFIIE